MEIDKFYNQLNSFFDHIYVITLERATDRQKEIRKELSGLNYQFFYGIDKKNITVSELPHDVFNRQLSIKHHRFSKEMQDGQIGCAWSHLEVYKDILKNNYSRVLIFEDDIIVDFNNTHLFAEVIKKLPSDWELLYLGFDKNEKISFTAHFKKLFYHLLSGIQLLKFSHKTIKNLYPKKVSDHLYKSGYHDCTHAYALTRSAAEKLINLQKPISFIADNLLSHAVTNEIIKGYVIIPRIVNQQYQIGNPIQSYVNH